MMDDARQPGLEFKDDGTVPPAGRVHGFTINEITQILRVDRRRVEVATAGLSPVGERGRWDTWDMALVVRRMFAADDAAKERLRLARAKADTAEMEAAEKRLELVKAADVDQAMRAMITTAREQLLLIGRRAGLELSTTTTPAGCAAVVDRAVREVLEDLAVLPVVSPPPAETPAVEIDDAD